MGGVFASTGPLEFGELQVYGRCTLPAGCEGKKLSTFGKLSVEGDLGLRAGGRGRRYDVRGDLSASEVLVNGKLEVSGSLSRARGRWRPTALARWAASSRGRTSASEEGSGPARRC